MVVTSVELVVAEDKLVRMVAVLEEGKAEVLE